MPDRTWGSLSKAKDWGKGGHSALNGRQSWYRVRDSWEGGCPRPGTVSSELLMIQTVRCATHAVGSPPLS